MLSLLAFLIISISFEWSSVFASDIPTPPYFTTQSKKEVFFYVTSYSYEIEQPFELKCEAGGQPRVSYTWYKNGKIFESQDHSFRINKLPGRGTLVFLKPKYEDQGIYQCKASNMLGTAWSNTISVKKSELDNFPNQEKVSLFAEEGKPLTLNCKPPFGIPKPINIWIMQPIYGTFRPINNSRITTDPEGNLHFSNFTVSDQIDGSYYVCSVNSPIRNEFKMGGRVKINIQFSGSKSAMVPPTKQYVSPSNILALRGDTLRLYCIFGGTPLPEVEWFKNGSALQQGRFMYENFGKTLVIKPVNMTDEGSYECKVNNSVGTAKSHFISVTVQASPYWKTVSESLIQAEGETATFECEAQGSPKPKMEWFKNGEPLSGSGMIARHYMHGNKLTVENLTKFDTAVYQCNASNIHGYVYTNFYLNVMSLPPTIIKRPENETHAIIGSTVNITCVVTGYPIPELRWVKNTESIAGSKYTVENRTLKIVGVNKSDEGVYKCIAINKFGLDQVSTSLMIKNKTVIITNPLKLEVVVGTPAIFKCGILADDSLPLDVMWLHNGFKIDYKFNPRLFKLDDNSLVINNTIKSDFGRYTCVASTPLDQVRATASLIIKDVPDVPILENTTCVRNKAVIRWRSNGRNNTKGLQYIVHYTITSTDNRISSYIKVPPNRFQQQIMMKPYAKYNFFVIAENSIGQSMPSNRSETCRTPPERPYGNPKNVVGYGTTSSNLIIKWTPMPEIDHNGPGFYYRITWRRSDVEYATYQTVHVDPSFSSFEINNLPANKPYRIKVEAMNNLGTAIADGDEVIAYSGKN